MQIAEILDTKTVSLNLNYSLLTEKRVRAARKRTEKQ